MIEKPEPRQYQADAIDFLRRRRRGLIHAPAGSGKTVIAACAIQAVLEAKPRAEPVRVGWIANTTEQVNQGIRAMERYTDIEMIDLRIACATGGPDMSDRDVLIVDEAHHSPAPVWSKIIESCQGAIWGFTATPFDDHNPDRNDVMKAIFQDVFRISRDEVKALAKAKVQILDATDTDIEKSIDAEIRRVMAIRKRYSRMDEGQLWSQVAFQVCIEQGIVTNEARNQAVIDRANHHVAEGDSVLVLIHKIDHGERLVEDMTGAVLCYSKMGKKKRQAAIEGFRDGSVPCIIATSLADEGLDIPRANILIMAGAGKSAGRVEQRTGRVLRFFEGKSHGLIYDFHDSQHPLLANQSRKRQAIYHKLGYEVRQ